MAAARSHKELICWQRAYELKLPVYELVRIGTVTHDFDFTDQLKKSASSAPRLIAEGFGRYYPAEFSKYLRLANGELKETVESLDAEWIHATSRKTKSFRSSGSRSDRRRPHLGALRILQPRTR
jgi:four helix bundle protein